jgi:hypothetical protein
MSRFAGLKQDVAAKAVPPPAPAELVERAASTTAKAREGKKPVMGYFSPEVRRTLHQLALDEGTTIQALLGEALDLLMRARGKHPFGER